MRSICTPSVRFSLPAGGTRLIWFPWYIITSESDGQGSPPIATGVGASVPLGQQARSEQTPDALTNHSPNPCQGFQARRTRLVQARARFALTFYPIGGEKQ
jgi:hypothetical protein